MSMDKTCLNRTTVEEYLRLECEAMMKYALGSGLKMSSEMVKYLQTFTSEQSDQRSGEETTPPPDLKDLVFLHDQLSIIVAPVKPRSIFLLEKEFNKKSIFKFLGPIPLIRRMMSVAILSIIALFIISSFPEIDATPENWDPLNSSGWGHMIRMFYILAAASIGVSFYSLFQAKMYMAEKMFESANEATFWIRYIQGIMAGSLLAIMIPIEVSLKSDFGKPLLALIGGFSSDVVYQILNQLIDKVKSTVTGDNRAGEGCRQQSTKARIDSDNIHNRFQLASEIMKMQQQMSETAPDEIKQKLSQLADKLLVDVSSEKGAN
jgi:hypothetical protein